MDLKTLTMGALQAARPDLVEGFENDAVQRLAEIIAEMTDAGFDPANKNHFTAPFLRLLLGTKDTAARSALIADRAAAANATANASADDDQGSPAGKESFILRRYTGRSEADKAALAKRFVTHRNLRGASLAQLRVEALSDPHIPISQNPILHQG
jgi:hypothetical protein